MNQKKPAKNEYLIDVVFYSDSPNFSGQKPWNHAGKKLYMMFPTEPHRQLQVKGPDPFPGSIIKKLVRLGDKEFKFSILMFLTDEDFEDLYGRVRVSRPIVAFKIFSVGSIDTSKRKHNPLSKKLKNAAQKISIHNKYIETKLNTSFNT